MACNHFHGQFSVCYWLCAPVLRMALKDGTKAYRHNHHRFSSLWEVPHEPILKINVHVLSVCWGSLLIP